MKLSGFCLTGLIIVDVNIVLHWRPPVIAAETQAEAQVWVQSFRPLPRSADNSDSNEGVISAFYSCNARPPTLVFDVATCFHLIQNIMSTYRQYGKGKTPITDATTLGAQSDEEQLIDQLLFGLNKMKDYFVQCKENQSITTKARFKVDSFKDDFPNIYDQFSNS
ncbi:hypothetical protein HAX54_053212 [Datura stramonium]|uniref:Uncharacterized protein n=1 Tax=Datura stramonium TaxID=4076 RepID=A0ABS8WTA6_DATST|nr:hypothetical protein [Datura stramonium]